MAKLAQNLRDLAERSSRFGREFTSGLSSCREVARLFDEDAKTAYAALSDRARESAEEPDDGHLGEQPINDDLTLVVLDRAPLEVPAPPPERPAAAEPPSL